MVKIHEFQHSIENPCNFQEREIYYESWEKYCEDIITFDGMKSYPYPSFPRRTKVYGGCYSGNMLIVYFNHRFFNETMKHIARLEVDCDNCKIYG